MPDPIIVMRENVQEYVHKFLNIVGDGFPVMLSFDEENGVYLSVIDEEEQPLTLKLSEDNRYGQRLNS